MIEGQRATWQIAGGPTSRSYADLFLRHGVALIGPGDAGPWRPGRYEDDTESGFIRRFATEVKPGDVFLLRTAMATVRAVGVVADDYLYLNQFDDVNGWDLQHARRVHWCRLPQDYTFASQVFGGNPTRFSRTWADEAIDYAHRFLNSPPTHWQSAPLPSLPAEDPPLEQVPGYLSRLVAEIHDLAPLYSDPPAFGEQPTEDELVGHFVLPFFRALGWPPERIAVKWRRIDVALFTGLPRTPQSCQFVIEAKRVGAGVEGALDQAKGYVEALGVPRDIVVTDGIRYRMYHCGNGFAPVAYANLARLKQPALELFERLKRV